MAIFDTIPENSLSFKYIDSGIYETHNEFYEKTNSRAATVISQLFKGEGEATAAGEKIIIPEGATVFFRKDLPLEYRARGKKLIFRWAHIDYVFDNDMDLLSLYEHPCVFDRKTSTRLGHLVLKLAKFARSPASLDIVVARRQIGWGILQEMLPFMAKKENYRDIHDGYMRIRPALKLQEKKFPERVSPKDMAREVGLSVSRFHEVFHKTVGFTPHEFMLKKRLQKACDLLKNSDMTIDQIAESVGFCDRYHFSKAFKRDIFISPGRYREKENHW